MPTREEDEDFAQRMHELCGSKGDQPDPNAEYCCDYERSFYAGKAGVLQELPEPSAIEPCPRCQREMERAEQQEDMEEFDRERKRLAKRLPMILVAACEATATSGEAYKVGLVDGRVIHFGYADMTPSGKWLHLHDIDLNRCEGFKPEHKMPYGFAVRVKWIAWANYAE